MSSTAVPTLKTSSAGGVGRGFSTMRSGPGVSTMRSGPGVSTIRSGPGVSTVVVSPGTVIVFTGAGAFAPQAPGVPAIVTAREVTVRPLMVTAADSDAFTPQRARSARP